MTFKRLLNLAAVVTIGAMPAGAAAQYSTPNVTTAAGDESVSLGATQFINHGLTAYSSDSTSEDDDTAVIRVGANFNVMLRAERGGKGDGQVYTIHATAADIAGNIAQATAACIVPHDRRGSK